MTFGLLVLALGGFGIYDNWLNVLDVFIAIMHPITILVGTFLFGVGSLKSNVASHFLRATGAIVVVLGFYGIYVEWGTFADFMMGMIPMISILIGACALVSGVNKLKA